MILTINRCSRWAGQGEFMRITGSLFLLCFLTIGVFSQQNATVSGEYRNNGFKEINSAIILFNDSIKLTVYTDANSKFKFENVPAGKYTIENSNRFFKKEIVVRAGQKLVVDVFVTTPDRALQPSVIREEVNIEISAGTSQPISEVSKTVNIISAEEISDRNEISLTDTLRTIPGFRVQQLGGFGRTTNIKTRGLRNQDTAILIDGIRFRDPAAITGDASAFLSDFSTANVGRVEVLRGSGSSIYGTNAIGGVINFQTPQPQRRLNGSFLSEYGGFGMSRFRGDIGAGTSDGKLALTTGFSRTKLTEGIDGEDDADNTNFQGRIDFNPFANTNISGRIYLSDAFVRLNANPDTVGIQPSGQVINAREGTNFVADINDPDNFQRSGFFSGQIALTQIINAKTIFSATYQGLKTERENENGDLGPGFQPFGGRQFSLFDGQIHTFNSKLDWIPAENNRITFGYEFEWEKFGNKGTGPTPAGDFFTNVDQASNTIYARNMVGLFENKLQLAGGVRLQFFSLNNPEFSINNAPYSNLNPDNPPNAYTFDGAVSYYFASIGTKIRGHVGNGYRVPSLYERFGSFYSSFFQDFTAIGDPNLEPERSVAFDAGIEQTFMKNRIRLVSTYFYTKLTDTIGYGNVVPDIGTTSRPFGGYENTKGGIARGAEFSGEVKPTDSTDIFVSYTYTNSDQRVSQITGSGIIRTLGIPDHQFTLVATQRFGKRLIVNFDYVATSSYLAPIFSNSSFSTVVYRFEGNNRGDITARYSFLRLKEKYNFQVFGTFENIFDNEYFENGFRTAGASGRFGVGLNF
jgi:iron complex outermembrane receptor protein